MMRVAYDDLQSEPVNGRIQPVDDGLQPRSTGSEVSIGKRGGTRQCRSSSLLR